MSAPLYHGGVRRLDRKGLILPPAKTGQACGSDYGAAGVHRRDRVYMTTELDQAEFYALMAPGGRGDVYEVEPIGELEVDPDYTGPGASYAAPMARIARAVRRNVTTWFGLTPEQAATALLTPDGDRYVTAERFLAASYVKLAVLDTESSSPRTS